MERSLQRRIFRTVGMYAALAALVSAAALIVAGAPNEKKISVYSTAANYSLPLVSRNGHDYVGLLEILEPLGTVTAKVDGSRWRFRYNDSSGEFKEGKSSARIRGQDCELNGNFIMENGRGLVPLSSLATLLPRFLGGPVSFHESARRLFVGNIAVHFTAQIDKAAPALVMNFSSPVNPTLATEPGKLRMTFTHEPLVAPGSQTLTFESKQIPSATYREDNGAAEVTVTGTAPLFAKFSNDGRTITIAPAPQPAAQNGAVPGQPEAGLPGPSTQPQVLSSPPTTNLNQPSRLFALIDASHGGSDDGATLGEHLLEKDVTLAFARRLRQQLQGRGLSAGMVRDSDSSVNLDERANLANTLRPEVYVCVHASSQGNGVRLYSGLVPVVADARGVFLDWNTAQSLSMPSSQALLASLDTEFRKAQVPVRNLIAPLRPLNNIVVPAIAIEVGPQTQDVGELNSPTYQQQVATSVVSGLLTVRSRPEAGR